MVASLLHQPWHLSQYLVIVIAITIIIVGACIGSFLNVVIYRLPIGLPLSKPKRSFCPQCRYQIPMSANIPLITWLWQKGRCANCRQAIPWRYFLVELATTLLWGWGAWYIVGAQWLDNTLPITIAHSLQGIFYLLLATTAIVILCIDIEHMIIPLPTIVIIVVIGFISAYLLPYQFDISFYNKPWLGVLTAAIGGVSGWVCLWSVVRLGKWLYGVQKIILPTYVNWQIKQDKKRQQPVLLLDGDEYLWEDLFFRPSDQLILTDTKESYIDNNAVSEQHWVIRVDRVSYGTQEIPLANINKMTGKVQNLRIPREVMGMGDVYLLAAIGVCFGAKSLLWVIFAACIIGILIHCILKIGKSKPCPFAPSLIIAAALWPIIGKQLWQNYLILLT